MSDHQQNPYHMQQQQQQQEQQQPPLEEQHPYMQGPSAFRGTNPRSPVLSTHPIPSSGSSASATEESSSNSRGSSSKRPVPSTTTTLSPSSSSSNNNAVDVVARTPSSTAASSRPTKKSKKSSLSSSTPSSASSGESVRSNNTTSGAARGLRHFSMMVCQKVEEKGTTTYNEVADELVRKVVAERQREDPNGSFDQKNIRRRVYDALNVLMAMDIISKQKKEITWKGLPTAAKQDMESMSKDIEYMESQLAQKKEALKDLLNQQVCFRNLVQRNHQRSQQQEQQQQQQQQQDPSKSIEKIPLPFIVVNTNKSAMINCDMSGDRTNVMFDFSLPFEISDDNTILKKMGMDRTSMSTLRQMLPEDLLHYCETNRLTDAVLGREDDQPQPLEIAQSLPETQHHEVGPYHHHQQHHHHQQQHRGNITIGTTTTSSSGSSGSGSNRGRLHDHHGPPPQHHHPSSYHPPPPHHHHHQHQQPPQYHPHHHHHHPSYDHHPGSRVRVPSRHQHPPPPIAPSSVSSSRRGMRDPYSY